MSVTAFLLFFLCSHLLSLTQCQEEKNITEKLTLEKRTGFRLESSCKNRCGQSDVYTCHCNQECVVYKTCCLDVEKFCPNTIKTAIDNYDLPYVDSKARCGPRSERYEVEECLVNYHDCIMDAVTSKDVLYCQIDKVHPVLHTFPIYDFEEGILFSNISIYSCYKNSLSSAYFWQMVLKMEFEDVVETLDDIERLMDKSAYFFRAPNGSEDGVKCMEHSLARDFLFSITIDFKESFIEVNFSPPSSDYQFDTMKCANNSHGLCTHISCGQNRVLQNGSCFHDNYVLVRSNHPPTSFSLSELNIMANYLKCVVEHQSRMSAIEVYAVRKRVGFPFVMYPVYPMKYLKTMNFFQMIFKSRYKSDDWNFDQVLTEALAAAYQKLQLVTGSSYLRFERRPSHNYKSYNLSSEMAESTKTLNTPYCEPHQTMDESVMNVHCVLICTNVYMIQTMDENNDFCRTGLTMVSKTSLSFEDCMHHIDDLMMMSKGYDISPCFDLFVMYSIGAIFGLMYSYRIHYMIMFVVAIKFVVHIM